MQQNNLVFLQSVYRACLGREPDKLGMTGYLGAMNSGGMDWAEVLAAVLNSHEFRERLYAQDGLQALHEARMLLFQQYVPRAARVLDLGGASSVHPEGALFGIGYPYAPERLLIIDLPPEQRFVQQHGENGRVVNAARGTTIEYVYRSMSDLSFLDSASMDLVVAGESIEHITESEADTVCAEAYRILKPGGHFCLDTPNARVTRIQSPGALIHPEHKKEYLVSELKDKLTRCGFRIERILGIVPMPRTVATQHFEYAEMAGNKRLSEDADSGYCFYLDAARPE